MKIVKRMKGMKLGVHQPCAVDLTARQSRARLVRPVRKQELEMNAAALVF